VRRPDGLSSSDDPDLSGTVGTASLLAADVQSHGGALEPISPELVLVDPELARAERTRLPADTLLQGLNDVGTIGPPVPPALPPQAPTQAPPEVTTEAAQVRSGSSPAALERPRRRLTRVLFSISLIANAVLIAVVVAGARSDQPSSALPVAPGGRDDASVAAPPSPQHMNSTHRKSGHARASSAKQTRTHRKSGRARVSSGKHTRLTQKRARPTRPRSAVAHTTNGAVERRVLAVVVQSPAGKLPRALIDPKTGLAKNNLQAVCSVSTSRSFLCIVRPARHKPTEGLYVRYRPSRNGPGVFTWYRYRSGS
jgi:hypothetical protein